MNEQIPTPVRLAWIGFIMLAGLWLAFAILSAINGSWLFAVAMLANAGVMVWLSRGIRLQRKQFHGFAVAVLIINLVLTITDQMGLYDWVALEITGLVLIVVLFTRRHYYTG